MAERVISERIIKEKVIEGGGLLGGIFGGIGRKTKSMGDAIGGLCIAPFVFLLAIGALYYSETFQRNAAVIGSLDVMEASSVTDSTEGLVKVKGKVNIEDPATYDLVGDVLYYDYSLQKYDEVEKKETEVVTKVVDGREVEQTVEKTVLKEEWVDVESGSKWAAFNIDGVKVKPDNASQKFDYKEEFIKGRYENTFSEISTTATNTPVLGDQRITVSYISGDAELIVIGEVSDRQITSGDPFIISNLSNAELTEKVETEENTTYMLLKGLTWLLFFISITMVLSPIMELVDIIPVIGRAATTAASVAAAVIALGIVILGTVIIKLWWLFLIGLVILFGLGVFILFRRLDNRSKKSDTEN